MQPTLQLEGQILLRIVARYVWKIISKLENVPSHRKISVVKLQFLSEAGVGRGDPWPSMAISQ